MWNPVGRNPTWHLSRTFNKKHWQRNFTLRAWVNFISPREALLALQPVRAVKIREQADAWLVCKCNMTITCSEHFKMQRSFLQQKMKKKKKSQDGAYFLQFSISSQPPEYFWKLFWVSACTESAQNLVLHSGFSCNWATIVTVVTVKSCGVHLQDWKKTKKEDRAGASPPGSELKHLITVQLPHNRDWWWVTLLKRKSKWIYSLKNTIVPSQSSGLPCRFLYLSGMNKDAAQDFFRAH